MSKVRVTVPATSANLGPGFNSLALALSLHNTIELSIIEQGLEFTIDGEDAEKLPHSPANLIVRSAAEVFRRTGCAPSGLHVGLESHIPVGSGLGSSAAATLGGAVAANILVGSSLNRDELLAIAAEVEGHPEAVTAALYGELIACTYDSSGLLYTSVPVASMQVIIAVPSVTLPTASESLPSTVSLIDATANIGRALLVVQALCNGDFHLLGQAMQDRIHEPVRQHSIPAYQQVCAAAKRSGAQAVTISGAGPALVAFASDNHEEIAAEMVRAFADGADIKARSWILPVDTQGISISEIGVPLVQSDHLTPSSPTSVGHGET